MKLFITGGAGFIGSNFIRHIFSTYPNYEVVNFDKLTMPATSIISGMWLPIRNTPSCGVMCATAPLSTRQFQTPTWLCISPPSRMSIAQLNAQLTLSRLMWSERRFCSMRPVRPNLPFRSREFDRRGDGIV